MSPEFRGGSEGERARQAEARGGRAAERVAIVGPVPPQRGGIAHFNARLLQELGGRAEVTAIGWSEPYPRWLLAKDFRDPSRWSGVRANAEPLLAYSEPRSWLRAAQRIGEVRPSRVVLHWVHPVVAPVYLLLLHRLRRLCPAASLELIVHNVLPHEPVPFGRLLSRAVFRRADRLVAHSEADAARLRGWLPGKRVIAAFHPVYDIFGPVRTEAVEELRHRLELRWPVLLFFGFLRPYKGVDLLIEAMPRILQRFPEATLVLAGESFWSTESGGGKGASTWLERLSRRAHPVSEDPLALVERLGVGDSVRHETRYIPNEEVAAFFGAADVVVLPYRSASQSGPLRIAHAYGKPVVVTRVVGLEAAHDTVPAACVAEPGCSGSLADAVIRCLRSCPVADVARSAGEADGWAHYAEILLESGGARFPDDG